MKEFADVVSADRGSPDAGDDADVGEPLWSSREATLSRADSDPEIAAQVGRIAQAAAEGREPQRLDVRPPEAKPEEVVFVGWPGAEKDVFDSFVFVAASVDGDEEDK